MEQDPLLGILQPSVESTLFFHPQNVDTIQSELRYRVYKKTGILVGPQSHKELLIVMRSVYLQESRHLGVDITNEISRLNELVLKYCVRIVSTNALQKKQYEVDAGSAPIPMSHPLNTSNRNRFTFSLHPDQSSMNRDYSVTARRLYPSARGDIEPDRKIPLPTPTSNPKDYVQGPRPGSF
jgi:hypothetical protein